jgi:ATP-binding cassette subfamily F protein 3
MARQNPDVREPVVRAKLGAFGFGRELADNPISSLSGGEKARLLFAFMSFDAPHLLLLDEPTNHLDIEAREALVMALNEYEGAVIIVSHDPAMLERVADRLWLVRDGACAPFDGDLEDYRKFIMEAQRAERRSEREKKTADPAPKQPDAPKAAKPNPVTLQKRAAQAEGALARLGAERQKLEAQMAAPDFYKDGTRAAAAQKDYDRILKEIEEQETIWLAAQGA